MYKHLLSILLALLCITSAAAQSLSSTGKGSQGSSRRVRLYGYVLDEQNRGIEACNVYWKESVATAALSSFPDKSDLPQQKYHES